MNVKYYFVFIIESKKSLHGDCELAFFEVFKKVLCDIRSLGLSARSPAIACLGFMNSRIVVGVDGCSTSSA